jgi:hypothetical protein
MNLSKASRWMIRQALGSKRGEVVIALLGGVLGEIIDMALGGQVSLALSKVDGVVDSVREVIG